MAFEDRCITIHWRRSWICIITAAVLIAAQLAVPAAAVGNRTKSMSLSPHATSSETETSAHSQSTSSSASKDSTFSNSLSQQKSSSDSETAQVASLSGSSTQSYSESSALSQTRSESTSSSSTQSYSESSALSQTRSESTQHTATVTTVTRPPTSSKSLTLTRRHSLSATQSPSHLVSDSSTQSMSGSSTLSQTRSESTQHTATVTTVTRPPTSSKSLTLTREHSLSATSTITKSHTWSAPTLSQQMSGTQSSSSSRSTSLSDAVSDTVSPTQTATISATLSASSSLTSDESLTNTPLPTPTPTHVQSVSVTHRTPSATRSSTTSMSSSLDLSPTATLSSTSSLTFSFSLSQQLSVSCTGRSPSRSSSATASVSLSSSATLTGTTTKSISPSVSETSDLSLTKSPTVSPSISASKSPTETITIDLTRTANVTRATWSLSHTVSITGSDSPELSASPSLTSSLSSSGTLSITHSQSVSPSQSLTMEVSSSASSTWTRSFSSSLSFTSERSMSPTISLTEEISSTESITISESFTVAMSETATMTLTASMSTTDTISLPLTTSPMPPTTTPVPTPTATLPTRCPTNCLNGVCQMAESFARSPMTQKVFYCNCYASTSSGFWAGSEQGGPCDRCARGYYGLRCLTVCPGGVCSLCGGHGVCNDGLFGDGTCSCYNSPSQGFWTGLSCSRCQPGYYGTSCTMPCMCDPSHSVCREGTTGDGSCICSPGWKGITCSECDATVNALCDSLRTCPGADRNCNGHGVCNFTLSDSGFCMCNPYYGTNDCSVECPSRCSGHGVCSEGRTGTGACTCNPFYLPPRCSSCRYGRFNSDNGCSGICPGGELNPCSGQGQCLDSGACVCTGISGGVACDLQCPTSTKNASSVIVCGGHGVCNLQGLCSCFSNATHGFWAGGTCEDCDSAYGGSDCAIACPLASDGSVCGVNSGSGSCNTATGACDCTEIKCGRACDVDKVNGVCPRCPNSDGATLYYGFDCLSVCACVHGNCSDGVGGDGSCNCEKGWSGPFCNITCPGGVESPCSGNGDCLQESSQCRCFSGFAGPLCNLSCANAGSVVCGGHGRCSDGVDGDGLCKCNDNWVWPETACAQFCNCTDGGSCPFPSTTCACDAGFAGDHCENCASGVYGPKCNLTCINGVTVGRSCLCSTGYAGANCSLVCPRGADGSSCNNRGTCDPVTGVCLCNIGWVGAACTCNNEVCKQQNINTVCDALLGQCVCVLTRTGPSCERCRDGYYGALVNGVSCEKKCDCSDNGLCDINTGACNCYADDANGYWTGGVCNQCLSGYMGTKCTQKSSGITQTTDLSRKTQTIQRLTHAWLDTEQEFLYLHGDQFNARFDVSSVVVDTPEVESLVYTIYNESIYGSVKLIRRNRVNASQFVILLQANITESFFRDPRLFAADSVPFLSNMRNTSIHALSAAKDFSSVLPLTVDPTLDYAFLDQEANIICGVPTGIVSRLYCKTVGPFVPSDEAATHVELPLRVQSALHSSWTKKMIFAGAASVTSVCTMYGLPFVVARVSSGPTSSDLPFDILQYFRTRNLNCTSITAMYETGGVLYFSALVPVNHIGAYNFSNNSFLVGQTIGGAIPCQAISYSPLNDIGYAVYGTLLIKFEVRRPIGGGFPFINAYGQLYTTSSLINGFHVDEARQIVYATTSSAFGFQVLRFTLVELSAITPNFADREGGALITVTGKGFRNVSHARCVFEKELFPFHTFINETTIICAAPKRVSSAVCLSQTLEVSMNNVSTVNLLTIERPASVIILSAVPNFVRVGEEGRNVLLSGRSFANSDFAVCQFVDPIDGHSYTTKATFNPLDFTYNCTSPKVSVPWSSQTFIQISLDGFVYPERSSSVPFLFVGTASAIELPTSEFVTVSSPASKLTPQLIAFIVDINNNRLMTLDTESYNISLTPGGSEADEHTRWQLRNSRNTSSSGVADLSEVFLVTPGTGTFPFVFTVGVWSKNISLLVNPGQVKTLTIKTQPQTGPTDFIAPGNPLPRQVEVSALDEGGNVAATAAGNRAQVYLARVKDNIVQRVGATVITSALFTNAGSANLGSQVVYPVFGVPYVLLFEYEADPSINTTTNVFYAGCSTRHYFVNGTSDCRRCDDEHFICNGTDIIEAKEGHWRAAAVGGFYTCPIRGACAVRGQCNPGYTGPLCGVCDAGYGFDLTGACAECPRKSISVVTFVFVALFQVSFLSFMSIAVVQNWKATNSLFVHSIITMIIAFGHFQMASLLGSLDLGWTQSLRDIMAVLGIVFAFELHRIRAINCLLNAHSIDAVWFAVIYSLIVVCLIPIITAGAGRLLKWFPWLLMTKQATVVRKQLTESNSALHHVRLVKKIRHKDGTPYIKEHQRKALAVNITQVVVTFCFQTSCKAALQLFRCVTVRYSDTEVRSYLKGDLSVSCDSDDYKRITGYSTFLIFAYVILIPLLFIFGVAYSRKVHSEDDFRLYTSFTTIGVKDMAFFWNGLLFFRRAAVIACSVFMDFPMQGYMSMWIVTVTAWIEHYIAPWQFDKHMLFERVGFMVLVFIANIVLVVQQVSNEAVINAVQGLLLTAISILFAFTLYVTLYRSLRELQLRIKEKSTRDSDDTEKAVGVRDVIHEQTGVVTNALKDMVASLAGKVRDTAAKVVDAGYSAMPVRPASETPGAQPAADRKDQQRSANGSESRRSATTAAVKKLPHSDNPERPVFEEINDVESESDSHAGSDDSGDGNRHASLKSLQRRTSLNSVRRPLRSVNGEIDEDNKALDPSTVRRMELERDIDDYITGKGFGVYQQKPMANSLFDTRDAGGEVAPPVSPVKRSAMIAALLLQQKHGTVPRELRNVIGDASSSESDDRSVDSDL